TKGGRFILQAITLIVLVLITITFLSYRLLTKSLPKTNGTSTLTILDSPVHVYWDGFGVPHIFAENENDLFKTAGYVTAQDRLWQMDFNRRAATGRLAEIFGKDAIESDIFIRTWGFNRTAQEIFQFLSPESRQVLEAYTEGVNAYIASHMERLPIEFSILRYKPELWKVEDSVAFSRLMAWKLSFSWYVEIVLAQLVNKLGETKARDIFPGFPKQGPVIVSANNISISPDILKFLSAGITFRNFLGMKDGQLGSNSWVVSGEKSVCGKPLLANDPHLELTMPSIWYEMHLSGGEINVAGVALPGTPGVLIGHNQKIAWGLTNGMVDDVDFFVEKVNPDNPEQYWNGRTWIDFKQVEEKILVKDENPVTLQIQFSRNGPIISKIHPLLKNKSEAVAMYWTGYQPGDEFKALLQLQKAKDWDDFKNALSNFKVPVQNFVFASVDGDIGYYLAGTIPIRYNASGILPQKGWLHDRPWRGEVPFEKLPHVLNPVEHYIVTANNKIVDARYPYYITNLWEPASRAARIHQLLSAKEKFSISDFKSMQMDVVSVHAQTIMPILLQAVKGKLELDSDDNLSMLYDLIKDWDGKETKESIAAAIFNAFFIKLTENTLKDEMGEELFKHYIRLGNVPIRVLSALLENDKTQWFDNVLTPTRESRADIIVKSFLDAGTMLKKIAGENISNWTWGQIHTLTMAHPLGNRQPLDVVLNLGPFPRAGSNTTINNAEYRFNRPFDAYLGPSTRQLVDFCDINHTLSVITSGQSGQRMSEHYKDQTPLWLEGRYHEMVMDSVQISRTAAEHLILTP
ncbi:MAG: penicillin acylase family protein, partial [bacterium]